MGIMAKKKANPRVDYFTYGANDEQLTVLELGTLSLFNSIKKVPSFGEYPGSTVLRKCAPKRVLCNQGESGASAFYILSTEDVLDLRIHQVACLNSVLRGTPVDPEDAHPKFSLLSRPELEALRLSFEQEIDSLMERLHVLHDPDQAAVRDELLTVAKVKLFISGEDNRPKVGLLQRVAAWFKRPAKVEKKSQEFIPIDSMISLDAKTLEAGLQEREVFGEMSCQDGALRSATVFAEQPCYILEFLRNILDMLDEDEEYKKKSDEIYRQRVLDKQVRRLSVFKDLTDEEFQNLRPRLDLKRFSAGTIIFDEHEESDCLYLVRRGLVKVVKHASALISLDEAGRIHGQVLAGELVRGQADPASFVGKVWLQLAAKAQAVVRELVNSSDPDGQLTAQTIAGLNGFIRSAALWGVSSPFWDQFKDKKSNFVEYWNLQSLAEYSAALPDSLAKWSDSASRDFRRELLELACHQGLPKREVRPTRILNYLGKGEILGELGVFSGKPRSATCIAFDQRDRGHKISKLDLKAKPSRIELVQLKKSDLALFSQEFRRKLELAKDRREQRLKENAPVQSSGVRGLQSEVPEYEHLGLVQGQQLMLIDLEKCTRCGACVEACVDSHSDGRNRLYLDGPRFDKYLIPVTCRSCLDPVCLIGCPVGAIYRGDNDEIRIRNHCIGCATCTDQCPYGSIHRSDREPGKTETSVNLVQLETGFTVREVTKKAVVCDLCSSTSSGRPACVYVCPHDAALRVNARDFFSSNEN
jgi:Fe-S-cluster-containing hydrogenase component 2/CRP-like cAMP-binding protein